MNARACLIIIITTIVQLHYECVISRPHYAFYAFLVTLLCLKCVFCCHVLNTSAKDVVKSPEVELEPMTFTWILMKINIELQLYKELIDKHSLPMNKKYEYFGQLKVMYKFQLKLELIKSS